MGANGSGKSHAGARPHRAAPAGAGSVLALRHPARTTSATGTGSASCPQRGTATGGVPATVREVVASGRLTRRRLLRPPARADRAAIDDALEVVGLADRAGDGVSTLSGGQQQRVLIARALAGEPDLFFLDEPTAGVDLPNQQALADALRTLSGRGATVVLVAHELGPLEPLVDRAVVMRDGRIAYDGAAARRTRTCTATTTRSTPGTTTCPTSAPPSTRCRRPGEGGR